MSELFNPYIERPVATQFLNTLAQSLKSPNLSPLLLQVWGVGGVGKSTLSRRAEAANPQAVAAFVEFDRTEGATEPIGVMRALHQQLQKAFAGQPDPFGKRSTEYFDAIHKLNSESEDGKGTATAEQIETVKKAVVWAAKGIGGLTPVGAELAGAAAEAVAPLIASEADRWRNLVQRHRATKGKRELQELILAPLPRLTDAFVESLSHWSKQRPILLRLDTYEKAPADVDSWLWSTLLGNHANLRDLRLRILVTGRHELRNEGWRKLKQDRPGWIEQWSLQRLNPEQTQDYLQRIGFTDATQIARIAKITKGLPYYLNWIRKKRLNDEEPLFVEGNEEIARLLLQGLDEAKQRMIELAACCRTFDRTLLEMLGQQHQLTVEFDWLVNQSFVERANQNYQLDDVARDVFRQEFCRNRRDKFEQTFEALMRYFKGLSDREVPAASPAPDKYENETWRTLRTEYLYYLLFSRKPDLQLIWISHLLEAIYFGQDRLVQLPLRAIDVETTEARHPYLSSPTYHWLQQLRPAIKLGWAVLQEDPIDYPSLEKFGLTREAIHKAIELCLQPVEQLSGLAKFAALFYRSRRCPEAERLKRLLDAKAQAEQIATKTYPEFSSDLLTYRIGVDLVACCSREAECFKRLLAAHAQVEQIVTESHPEFSSDLSGVDLIDFGIKATAISSFDKALEFKPDNFMAWFGRGCILLNFGLNEEAIFSFDKALEVEPDDCLVWFRRGLALSALGRHEEAISSYDTILECKSDYYEAWYNRGNAFSALGRNEDAISSYDKVLECKPDSHETWHNRGNALAMLGCNEDAIFSFDKAIEFKPDFQLSWLNRGKALSALGRNEEAISSYDKAIEVKPDDHEAWLCRGLALYNLGRKEEAIFSYDKVLEVKPDLREVWLGRGKALYELGRKEEAISSYDKALEVKPNDHVAWLIRGVALSDLGRNEEAISSFDKAIEFKSDYYETWYNRGNALYNLGRNEEAISSYDKAIEFKPDYYVAWNNRGNALSDLGRNEDAIFSCDKAIEFKPDDHDAWTSRGIALAMSGRNEDAISSFDEAIEFKPDYHYAWYNKACCHARMGDVIEAVDCLSRAIALDPKNRELAQTDSDFDAIRGEDWFRGAVEGD